MVKLGQAEHACFINYKRQIYSWVNANVQKDKIYSWVNANLQKDKYTAVGNANLQNS